MASKSESGEQGRPVEGGVEVDAVRAPVAPIRIAVGAPDPLGLGVGEHDAPGGEAPCSCGAWHREAVAEPAPVPLAALTGCDSHSVTPRASCAECNAIAEREEPSFRTGCAEHLRIWGRGCETCDRLRAGGEPAPREPSAPDEDSALEREECIRYIFRLERVDRADDGTFTLYTTKGGMDRVMSGVKLDLAREIMRRRGWISDPAPVNQPAPTDDPGDELARLLPGLLDLARARIKALTIPGPPPLNLASESIKLARACELLLGERERLTAEGTEKIADRDCDIAMLRARVAELEEERENLLDEIEGSGELNPYALTVIESAREAQKGASE